VLFHPDSLDLDEKGLAMSPNGRRRWRRARAPQGKGRTFYGPDTKATLAAAPWDRTVPKAHLFIRRHRNSFVADGKTVAEWYPPELPVKPFSPKSLVGMSQSARKRRIRLSGEDCGRCETCRNQYRIGERLRPCPGCNMCGSTCGACEDQCPDGTRCLQCGRVMYEETICDGSGVLTSRRMG
jgi:hypothetical protein